MEDSRLRTSSEKSAPPGLSRFGCFGQGDRVAFISHIRVEGTTTPTLHVICKLNKWGDYAG